MRANGPMLAFGADDRAFDVAEGVDRRAVGDLDAGAEDHVRLDRHVAAELGVVGEPHALGIDQRRAFVERLLAPAALPFELEVGELGAAVDAGGLVRIAFDDDRLPPLGGGDVDDVGQVIFARRIVVADLAQPAEQVGRAHRHHAGIAQADRALLLGRVLDTRPSWRCGRLRRG